MKKQYTYIALGLFTIIAWMGGIFFTIHHKPARFKMNPVHEIAANKKHVISNLFHAFGMYFWKIYPDTWMKGIEPSRAQKKEQRKLFGYNLRIEHIIDKNPNEVINKKRPTVFIHGWGDTQGSARLLKAYCDVLPGDIVTFNFRDRGPFFPKFQHSSLGQLPDVLQTLYVIKWTKDTLNPDGIDLFGYSRGGATAINLLAALNDKSGAYDEELARIGIDTAERQELLRLIQNGCIVLNCPLMDLNVTAVHHYKQFAPEALKALASVSNYELDGMQAINSAQKLDGLNLKILLHFQYNDRIVFNDLEAEFYTRLAQHNPDTTFIVLGNDGGHTHTHKALSETVHPFKKMFGGSYDPEYVAQYRYTRNNHQFANKLLQPKQYAASCIENYYQECKQTSNH